MENIFYQDEYYSELSDLMDALDLDEDNVHDLPDDYVLNCKECDLEPIIELSANWICEHISEERFSEEGIEADKLYKILAENIDYEKVNALIPKLYYESRKKFTITKNDLIEYCK